MKTLIEHQTKPHAPGKAMAATSPLPTCANPPRGHENDFISPGIGEAPEFDRLPAPGSRCRYTSLSRTALIGFNADLSPELRFLTRLRRRGKLRGSVLVNVGKLLAAVRAVEKAEEGER